MNTTERTKLTTLITKLKKDGKNSGEIADTLNEKGFVTGRGSPWDHRAVSNFMTRVCDQCLPKLEDYAQQIEYLMKSQGEAIRLMGKKDEKIKAQAKLLERVPRVMGQCLCNTFPMQGIDNDELCGVCRLLQDLKAYNEGGKGE